MSGAECQRALAPMRWMPYRPVERRAEIMNRYSSFTHMSII